MWFNENKGFPFHMTDAENEHVVAAPENPPTTPPESRSGLRAALICLVAVLVVAGVGGAYFYYTSRQAEEAWNSAQTALAAENLPSAIRHLEAFLQYKPNHAEGHFLLARTYRRANLPNSDDRMSWHLMHAERLQWPVRELDLESLLLRVQQLGAPEQEPALLQMVREGGQEREFIIEAMLTGLYVNQRLADTQTLLDFWVEAEPRSWKPYFWRGGYYQRLGRLTAARQDLERAHELHPDQVHVRQRLAEWYVRNGQSLATANSHLQAYLKEYPEDTGALITLARCRRAQGEPDAARQSMVQVVQKQPDQTNAWLLLAILESDLDQPEKALEALTRLETCPPLEDAEEIQTKLQLQANVFRRLNRAIEAETFESALKKHKEVMLELTRSLEDAAKGSTDLTLRRKIGLLYVEAGLEKGARAWLGPILAKNPDDKEVHQALLKHYESRKDAAAKELADLARRRIAELSR